jgi:multiple sugar transport system permease protein
MPAIVIFSIWKFTGLHFIYYLIGFENIPGGYYEAARIDGAGEFKIFTRITLPLLTPSIFYVFLTTLIGTMQAFDEPFFVTGGGPGDNTRTVALFIYEKAFQSYDMGYASAVAALLFIVIFVMTAIQMRVQNKWVVYDYE